MWPWDGFKFFLVVIDIFSRRIFTHLLKSKKAQEVSDAFKVVFKDAGVVPAKIEVDQGKEFNPHFFREQGVYFKIKLPPNKASYAEHAIFLVKRRLYRLMRVRMARAWPRYLDDIVKAINNSKNSAIGGLRPSQIQSPLDDPLIDAAVGLKPDVPVAQQKLNQANYEKDPARIQVGSFVHIDFPHSSPMDKSFESKRYMLFKGSINSAPSAVLIIWQYKRKLI